MAQVTALAIYGVPGMVHAFLAKTEAEPDAPLALTPQPRSTGLTPETRSVALTPGTRGVALTPESRP